MASLLNLTIVARYCRSLLTDRLSTSSLVKGWRPHVPSSRPTNEVLEEGHEQRLFSRRQSSQRTAQGPNSAAGCHRLPPRVLSAPWRGIAPTGGFEFLWIDVLTPQCRERVVAGFRIANRNDLHGFLFRVRFRLGILRRHGFVAVPAARDKDDHRHDGEQTQYASKEQTAATLGRAGSVSDRSFCMCFRGSFCRNLRGTFRWFLRSLTLPARLVALHRRSGFL